MNRILTSKVVVFALVIGSTLLCASLLYIFLAHPAAAGTNLGMTASALTVIPAPSSTPRPLPPTLTPLPPTPTVTDTPGPDQIAIGVYVQPTTGGEGLRVHTSPSLSADYFSAFDSEAFQVTKGPEQAEGYTWWYLTASYDANRSGWAVQDFLTVIPKP
ncbi:MAG TPA: hypothetical protein VMC09_18080 [Anaerolineales bacterium]|nr:hypothetical protein [Anaerolineales bacterium]